MRHLIAVVVLLVAGCASQRPVLMVTDFGTQDHYAAVLEFGVLRQNPQARIATISHDIEPYNILEGAFVLAEAVPEHPGEVVVLGVVDPGVGTERAPIVVETVAGDLLVGPDNGLFDPLIRRSGGARAVYRIADHRWMRPGAHSSTFHGRDIFAPIAGHLSRGLNPSQVGPPLNDWIRLPVDEPTRHAHHWQGTVLHVDHYGNLLTNMPREWLQPFAIGSRMDIVAPGGRRAATVQRTYGEVEAGAFVIVGNESGWVEIAQNQAHAGNTLGIHAGQTLTLRP